MSKAWPHQLKAFDLVRQEFKKGNKWVCLVMATGAGKTVTGGFFAKAHLEKVPTGRVLWTAHREELIGQAYDTLTELGLSCGVIQATPVREVNPHRPVQIASIQTIIARNIVVPDVTLMIPDEAHHLPSDKWSAPILRYKQAGAFGVGLTATPVRADGLPLGDIFDEIVSPITMAQLIEQGFLVPYELVRPKKALRRGQIARRPIDAYLQHAAGRKTIVFAGNILSGEMFRDQFRENGITCELVTGEMNGAERRAILEAYKDGKVQVLCNVGVLTEGFDDRPTSCVILARSVGSIGLYLQICGRGLRTSPETGKTDAILVDLYGSSWTHGAPHEDRTYDLHTDGIRRKNLPAAPERFCAICGVTMEADAIVCVECGTEKAGITPPDVVNAPLVKFAWMRKKGTDDRVKYLKRWLAEAEELERKPGWAMHKYKACFGEWPSRDIVSLCQSQP